MLPDMYTKHLYYFFSFPTVLSSCDNVFTSGPNTFQSPRYPDNYPILITCTTLVMAPAGYIIKLSFIDFALEPPDFNGDCVWDSFNVYNGVSADPDQLIESYCGQKIPPPVFSSNNSMFTVFSSDDSGVFRGYEAVVEFISRK